MKYEILCIVFYFSVALETYTGHGGEYTNLIQI